MSVSPKVTTASGPPKQTDRSEHLPARIMGMALFLAMLWGGLAPTIKISLSGVPPLGVAWMRFGIGMVVIALWSGLVERVRLRPTRAEMPHLLAIGVLFTFQIATLNVGTRSTSAGHSSTLLSAYPLFVALLAHWLVPGDRLSPIKVMGMVAAFVGVAFVFAERGGSGGDLRGDACVLVSAILLAGIVVYTKRLTAWISPYRVLLGQMVVGVPSFLAGSLLWEGQAAYRFSWSVTLAILYQGLVVAAFCFVVWVHLIQRYSPSRVTAFSFSTPLFGVLLSALLLDEPVTPGLGIGVACVAVGIYLANRRG
jgi:drug/metabolite transporter (DMT)-like permease